jgi:hypothetical protein
LSPPKRLFCEKIGLEINEERQKSITVEGMGDGVKDLFIGGQRRRSRFRILSRRGGGGEKMKIFVQMADEGLWM